MISVLNPTSIEQSILRPSLLPGLLDVIKQNADHQNFNLSGFEIGKIHIKEGDHFKEQSVTGIISTGKSRPNHWERKSEKVDFYDLKGLIQNLLESIGLKKYSFEKSAISTFHPGRQASILINGMVVGSLGEVHELIQFRVQAEQMTPLPQFPGSERDWTITLKEETNISDAFDAVENFKSKLLDEINLLDVYRSEKLGRENKNVTFRFLYRNWKKTVSQEEVDAEHARITEHVLLALGKAIV